MTFLLAAVINTSGLKVRVLHSALTLFFYFYLKVHSIDVFAYSGGFRFSVQLLYLTIVPDRFFPLLGTKLHLLLALSLSSFFYIIRVSFWCPRCVHSC